MLLIQLTVQQHISKVLPATIQFLYEVNPDYHLLEKKTLTTQCLELQAAATAVGLKDKIVEIFGIQFVSIKFWVDS